LENTIAGLLTILCSLPPSFFFSLPNSCVPGFSAPIWRNTLLFAVAFAGIYRFSNIDADAHPARSSSSGHSAPGNESEDDLHDEDNRPFITRYIDYYSTPSSVWKERNERHLDMVREKAEEKLLFQDAERPPVHRLRYVG
jgi:hypothetical protein